MCLLQNIVFESFNIQAGVDNSGVATDMLSLNSTVRIHYRNPGTFFGVHVTSTPLELHYYQLKVASGQVKALPTGVVLSFYSSGQVVGRWDRDRREMEL